MSTATRIEKPMLFSAPMIRAILDGRKTQTRRVIKRQPPETHQHAVTCDSQHELAFYSKPSWGDGTIWPSCNKGIPIPHPAGSLIWVRETWADVNGGESGPGFLYKADGGFKACLDDECPVNYDRYPNCNFTMWAMDLWNGEPEHAWRPSVHMPKWAARIWLEVTDVRVERLQDISETDARAEGMPQTWDGKCYDPPPPEVDSWQGYGRASFALLWSQLNGPESWDANPWVRVYTFKRVSPDSASGGAA